MYQLADAVEVLYEASHIVNNELGYYWIPRCVPAKDLFINQVFFDLNSAFKYYQDYEQMCDFDVLKSFEEKKNRAGTLDADME